MGTPHKTEALAARETTALTTLQHSLERIGTVEEDPTERMVSYIAATPPEDWDALWAKLPNTRDNAGRVITVEKFRAAESDFDGALSHYAVCDVIWDDTGERGLMTCSSATCIAQLVALWDQDRLPARLEIVAKDKPTKKGFRPIHFRYLAGAGATAGAAVIDGEVI